MGKAICKLLCDNVTEASGTFVKSKKSRSNFEQARKVKRSWSVEMEKTRWIDLIVGKIQKDPRNIVEKLKNAKK